MSVLARHEEHARSDRHALLYPAGSRYRLEIVGPEGRLAVDGPPTPAAPPRDSPRPPPLAEPRVLDAVRWAAGRLGSEVLHVENLGGLPPESLLELDRTALRLVVSLHDFAAFCPRPHLIEEPHGTFCGYCRDLARCHRCLAATWDVPGGYQAERRQASGALLAVADRLVFPSEFLRRKINDLFVGLDSARQLVIPPAIPLSTPEEAPSGPPRRVAFVGGARRHKGGALLGDVVSRFRSEHRKPERWWVLGPGDPSILLRLRDLGVGVRGYYRAGSLPRLLSDLQIDLAVLASTSPESYSLTLSECWAARRPVIAFDVGAVGERIRAGGGTPVPPSAGAEGLACAIRHALETAPPRPEPSGLPSPIDVADSHRRLYDEVVRPPCLR